MTWNNLTIMYVGSGNPDSSDFCFGKAAQNIDNICLLELRNNERTYIYKPNFLFILLRNRHV